MKGEREIEPSVSFIPPGKIRCYITGKLRKETPEENVRQRVARSLVEEYGYPKEDIEIEFKIQVGSKKKRVDIAVFEHSKPHEQEYIILICETKREDVKPTDRDNGVDQLKSYLSSCPNARFGLWVGSELQIFEVIEEEGKRRFLEATDLPPYGAKEPAHLTFSQLVPAHEGLRAVFKRCHNYIYANQGLQKEAAFHEFLKLIFCKVHDERVGIEEIRFAVTNEERRSEIGRRRLRKRIGELFEEVKKKYSYIFPRDENIRLEDRVLAYIVSELQRYSLLQTDTDVKGEAYEEIVGANLRGDRGEFFTPRNVCRMAVEMVLTTYPKERWTKLKILDPACGTGGFLIAWMNILKGFLLEVEKKKWGPTRGQEEAEKLLKELCDENLFGIDFNPMLVRAGQMNLVMHGDGSINILHANSLLSPGEWPDDVRKKIKLQGFDIVITNPPFGSQAAIDDPHILDQFELTSFEAKNPRKSLPPEQLFIERCWQFLKPGGRLAIVLPDSILSNPGLVWIRRWIMKRFWIIASLDLPTETFEPFTGTQTSILVLQRKTDEEIRLEDAGAPQPDYEIFMAIAETVGHDRRGNKIYRRTPEGQVIEVEDTVSVAVRHPDGIVTIEPQKVKRPAIDDDLPYIPKLFAEWVKERNLMEWYNER